MHALKRFSLAAALLVLGGCTMTSVRMHEDYENHLTEVQKVAIVPPIVEMQMLNFDGENERMSEQEAEMKARLVAAAKNRLEQRGFEAVEVNRAEIVTQFENFNVDLANLRESYQEIAQNLYDGKPVNEKDMATFRQSVGSAASVIAHYTESDAILLMRYAGWEKSAGNVAKDMAASVLLGVLTAGAVVPVQATSGESVEAALIDGDSGDVIWTNVFHGGANNGLAIDANLNQMQTLAIEPEADTEVAEQGSTKL